MPADSPANHDLLRDLRDEARERGKEQGAKLDAVGAGIAKLVAIHEAEHDLRVETWAAQRGQIEAARVESERRGAWLRSLLTPQTVLLLLAVLLMAAGGSGVGELVRAAVGLPAPAAAAPGTGGVEDVPPGE